MSDQQVHGLQGAAEPAPHLVGGSLNPRQVLRVEHRRLRCRKALEARPTQPAEANPVASWSSALTDRSPRARGLPADTQGFFHGTGNGKRPRNTASSRASAGLGGPRGTVLGWPVGSTRVVLDYPKVEHRNPGVPGPAAGRMRSRPPGHGADQPRSPSPVVAGGPRPDRPGRPYRGALLE